MRVEGNDLRLAAATATQIQQTGAQQVLAPRSQQYKEAERSSSKGDTVQSLGGDKVSIKVEVQKNTLDTLQKMGNISDVLNSVATNLRQTNEGLKAASNIVNDMKASLEKIIKNYPPYPIESRERMEQLMNFSSLQKQILKLMIPAPPPPLYEKVQHLWNGLTSGTSNTIQTPELPLDAPDSHVKLASGQLDSLSGQINLVQETLGNSVMRS